jgi:tripartite-type tricarboxylate transporter receptor subunit TctC
VRVIVNVAAGGVADVTMRVLGARMTETLGQTFLVENRAGGDGYIGFDAVARSDADGHTLLYSPGSSMMIAPHIVNRPDLDPLKVLAPIAATGRVSLYVITHPERPFKNFAEFLAHARANPGKLNYGTPGNGTSPHIATEVFNREAKVKLSHVPYKGAGPALNDTLAGQVQVLFDNLPSSLPHIQSGRLRALAVASNRRVAALPEVPTFAEVGLPQMNDPSWFGLVGPAKLPGEVVTRVRDALVRALRQPETVKRLDAVAATAIGNTPDQFRETVAASIEASRRVARESGLKFD